METKEKTRPASSLATVLLVSTLAGMLACQAVAAVWVRVSNLGLLARMKALHEAGYLTVPGPKVFPGLESLATPLYGALFYTLTVGAGLGFAFSLLAWAAGRSGLGRRGVVASAAPPWAGVLILLNSGGFTLPGTLFGLFIPLASLAVAWRLSGRAPARRTLQEAAAVFLPILILAGAWLPNLDRTLFLDLRDSLLLSNPVGKAVNELYYDYTLYPAESFKALQQKVIRTVRVEEAPGKDFPKALARGLAARDYLPVPAGVPADLVLRPSEKGLALAHGSRTVLEEPPGALAGRLEEALEEFSDRTDRHAGVRALTYYTLVFGFPLLLYLLVYAGLEQAVRAFRAPWGTWLPGLACLVFGLLALVPVRSLGGPHPEAGAADLLASNSPALVTAGIKKAMDERQDLCGVKGFDSLLTHENAAVRYWTARALRTSHCPRAFGDLAALARDPHRNVRCKALESLGYSPDPKSRALLLEILRDSGDWYVQMYAFRALTHQGWTQEWR